MDKECIHYCVGNHSVSLLVKSIKEKRNRFTKEVEDILVTFEDGTRLLFHGSWKTQFEKALEKKLMCDVRYHVCIMGR